MFGSGSKGNNTLNTPPPPKVLNQSFHDRLIALGYMHQDTGRMNSGGGPFLSSPVTANYYHPVSQRDVQVQRSGEWTSKKGVWGTRESGLNEASFFTQFHSGRKLIV